MIKVLFAPDYRAWNPYQRLLGQSLSRLGVQVDCRILFSQPFSVFRELFRGGKYDVLHLHWIDLFMVSNHRLVLIGKSILFLLELAVAKLMGTRVVWTVHNLSSHEKQLLPVQAFFVGIFLRFCDAIILHCTTAMKRVLHTYGHVMPKCVSIIPHGHFIDAYTNKVSRVSARMALGLSDRETALLHFGSIRPYKGIVRLIDAFKMVEGLHLRLIIVGLPLNEKVRKQVEDRSHGDRRIIQVFRFVSDDEVQVYMNAADAVVLGFEEILTSGSVLLAMSFGKPVIAPRLGCIPEVLDQQGAILYDPRGKPELEDAIREALKTDLTAMGKHNMEKAQELDWERIGERTYKVYLRCLATGPH